MTTSKRFSALYKRDYRYYYSAQIISFTGTWLQHIGMSWLVYTLTDSAFYLGVTGMSMSVPILLFTFFGGLIADRFNKRKILILTHTLPVFPALLLYILTVTETINIWEIIAIAFTIGTINAIDLPCRQSFLIEIAGKESLFSAIALNTTAFNGARVMGPLLAGIIIQSQSVSACFLLNAVSFMPMAVLLSRIRIAGESSLKSSESFKQRCLEGIRFIRGHNSISGIILTIGTFSLFGIPFNQFLPLFADRIFDVGAKGYSYLSTAMGAGALLAGLMIAFKKSMGNTMRYLSIAGFLFPITIILFSHTENFILALLLLILCGWSIVSFMATSNNYVQLEVKNSIRGRVMSLYSLTFLGMAPIGHLVIGFFADMVGIKTVMNISALLCIAGFLCFRRKWINLKTAVS